MPVHVTFGFNWLLTGDRRYSGTISRWLPLQNAIDGSCDAQCLRLAADLLGTMAGNVFLQDMRLSLWSVDATGKPVASRQRNRILVPAIAAGSVLGSVVVNINPRGAFTATFSDQPKSAVQVALDAQITGGGRGDDTLYLLGPPDDLIKTGVGGTITQAAVPGWSDAFAALLAQLLADGWAYLGTRFPPTVGPVQIVGWTNEAAAPNRLQFTIGSRAFGNSVKVHVRGIRNAVPRTPRAVGMWVTVGAPTGPDVNGNYTYTLANSSAFTASDIITLGTVESVTQAFYTYLGTGTPLRATTRKRGGSYGASRGRSRPRPRLLA